MKKYILILALAFFSCSKYSPEINKALKMAGENKAELIKVLEHFENQDNEEKLRSAEFLVKNLPYNYSYDTTNLHKYRIISNKAELAYKGKIDTLLINSLWDSIKIAENPFSNIFSRAVKKDIKTISSEFLINNVNEAYSSWKANPYAKDSISFDDFCEYILPYRQVQGKAIENWRRFFKNNNKYHFANSHPLPFTEACDSLFAQYEHYEFNHRLTVGIPMLKFKDFMKIKGGKCTIKSWLNTYIVASEGIPMAIDFVPNWGHRVDNHQWNALIYGGKSIYFESFWERNNGWTYNNKIINNQFEDDWSGKIRLPKVYRHTFSTHFEGPISDKKVKMENIPALFRNVKKKDVSTEYFNAVDIELNIESKIPEDTHYAYICVLGFNKQWVPVQWGKIQKNVVEFKKMGTDIIYQTGFFKDGYIIPFGQPFHLNSEGIKIHYIPQNKEIEVELKRKYPAKNYLIKEARLIENSVIQGSNRVDFKYVKDLEKIDFKPEELRTYTIDINSKKKYRYYRLLSNNKITVKEIEAIGLENDNEETSKKGQILRESTNKSESWNWIGVDLGKPELISKFKFTPRNNINNVLQGLNYELFYIDNGKFISLGRQKATSYELNYENVPQGALLYLKCLDEGRQERIFEYKNGKQIWY